jgi:hydroxyethylthiazole kinase-like uncharacterized protein yjeF
MHGLPDSALQRVLPSPAGGPAPADGWPLHGVAASRDVEAALAATLPPHTLMQRAGLAVARLAMAVRPHARQVWAAAGPGNNGGDALEAAFHLRSAGRTVNVSLLGDASRLPADAAASLQRARDAGVPITTTPPPPSGLSRSDLALDGLLGLGLSRPPAGDVAAAIGALGRGEAPVLAIDLPSGLGADSGQPLDAECCVQARWTLCLLTLKPGAFTGSGRDHAGEVWFDGLGADVATQPPAGAWLATAALAASLRPPRRHAHHKGSYGDLRVVGGAPSMTGAALLASRAALHAGAGRVYVHLLDDEQRAGPCDPMHPELMFGSRAPAGDTLSTATVVCGCGGGTAVSGELPALLLRSRRLLLDADALNAVAADAQLARRLAARASHGQQTVLTPHPLEAARLLGCTTAQVQADRLLAARQLADRSQAVVVLKGSGSVVAAPGLAPSINASGNAALAGPGTGDVLAGWIGGLWSQGLDAHDAARLGVFEHGAAADAWVAEHDGDVRPLPAALLLQRLLGRR